MVNHFEFEEELTNKELLFMNIMKYCDSNNISPFKYIPLTIAISTNTEQCTNWLNFKNNLFTNMSKYVENTESTLKYSDLFSFKCNSKSDLKYYTLDNCYINIPSTHFKSNIWVIKPTHLSMGLCIQIGFNADKIEKQIKKYSNGITFSHVEEDSDISDEDIKSCNGKKTYRANKVLLQKYIEKPLLFNGRKFDLRIFALITHNNDVFIFKYRNNNIGKVMLKLP